MGWNKQTVPMEKNVQEQTPTQKWWKCQYLIEFKVTTKEQQRQDESFEMKKQDILFMEKWEGVQHEHWTPYVSAVL